MKSGSPTPSACVGYLRPCTVGPALRLSAALFASSHPCTRPSPARPGSPWHRLPRRWQTSLTSPRRPAPAPTCWSTSRPGPCIGRPPWRWWRTPGMTSTKRCSGPSPTASWRRVRSSRCRRRRPRWPRPSSGRCGVSAGGSGMRSAARPRHRQSPPRAPGPRPAPRWRRCPPTGRRRTSPIGPGWSPPTTACLSAARRRSFRRSSSSARRRCSPGFTESTPSRNSTRRSASARSWPSAPFRRWGW